MLKKITTDMLQPGMYVVDAGLSWLENPYLYMTEGVVRSREHIGSIIDDGYQEVIIDTERSAGCADPKAEQEAIAKDLRDMANYLPPAPEFPLSDELPKARKVYEESVNYARSLINDIRLGKALDVNAAEPLVDDILESVTRNCDALVGLTKLRSFDEYTFSHSVNVSVLAVAFGRFLGKDDVAQRRLGLAGLFHDIGKLLVPAEILNKPGRLTEEEYAVMKQHPLLGFEHAQKQRSFDNDILLGMVDHHEKFNGKGYPRGLSGNEISEAGRIIAIADVYDALTSKRVYKTPMSTHKALGLMYSMRENDFHPGYVERFVKCLGIYPVGSVVRLNTGHVAVVASSNPTAPLKPEVVVVRAPGGLVRPTKVNLSAHESMRIETGMDAAAEGIDPAGIIGRAL